MIITATSAAIGMRATMSPSPTTRISRNTPARNVEMRVRAPDTFTLIIVWPIMAQPPMPPKNPVTMLATPCPQPSRVLSECESVMSSTSLAVISDSSSPTIAIASAYGAMIRSVSRRERHVREDQRRQAARAAHPGRRRSGTSTPERDRDDGEQHDDDERRRDRPGQPGQQHQHGDADRRPAGRRATAHRPARAPARRRSGSPSALTNPTITLRGMNRISLATPARLSTICRTPASSTVAIR